MATDENKQHGRQRVWEAMRELKQFTLPQLMEAAGIVHRGAGNFVRKLDLAGYLKQIQKNENGRAGSCIVFQLIRDSGPLAPICKRSGQIYDDNLTQFFGPTAAAEPPMPERIRQLGDAHGLARAWQSMRILQRFTAMQVAATAEIAYRSARGFVEKLARAGYLRRVKPNIPGQPGSYAVWQLLRNSGPQAPVCRRNGQVYDPNLEQLFGPASPAAEGEADIDE